MDVEVNEENIELFSLVKMTGNSREDMLSWAADARANGLIVSVKIPDNELHQNVFDNYLSHIVEELPNSKCRYEEEWTLEGEIMMCVIHGETSKHDAHTDADAPCLRVDPKESRKDHHE